jgi:lipopolysaccharide transport system ATP-binding protein
MSEIILKVENLSKLYRLGEVGTGTLSHDINRWWAKIRGKEDPYSKVGQINNRSEISKSDYVWSLKNISFDVNKGDVLGIIGKNGAGKSTLLKIISQITSPTEGCIKAKGRIASLLEVGTGMHPEMTARENIFLNGAILGMKKKEIESKFDEIVDFSGCAMYIDTPVKRFSSGMRVRLGFAVAAFLEPEILIVDEVLAVGDAEFQKKAIGKMQSISKGDGRTVLFVSHNMAAVQNLCNRGILLNNGMVQFEGTSNDTVAKYFSNQSEETINIRSKNYSYVVDCILINSYGLKSNEFEMGKDICIQIYTKNIHKDTGVQVGFFIKSESEERVAAFSTAMKEVIYKNFEQQSTEKIDVYNFHIKSPNLLEGKYYIDISIAYKIGGRVEFIENACSFNILSSDIYGSGVMLNNYFGKIYLDVETIIESV